MKHFSALVSWRLNIWCHCYPLNQIDIEISFLTIHHILEAKELDVTFLDKLNVKIDYFHQ